MIASGGSFNTEHRQYLKWLQLFVYDFLLLFFKMLYSLYVLWKLWLWEKNERMPIDMSIAMQCQLLEHATWHGNSNTKWEANFVTKVDSGIWTGVGYEYTTISILLKNAW